MDFDYMGFISKYYRPQKKWIDEFEKTGGASVDARVAQVRAQRQGGASASQALNVRNNAVPATNVQQLAQMQQLMLQQMTQMNQMMGLMRQMLSQMQQANIQPQSFGFDPNQYQQIQNWLQQPPPPPMGYRPTPGRIGSRPPIPDVPVSLDPSIALFLASLLSDPALMQSVSPDTQGTLTQLTQLIQSPLNQEL